MGSDDSACNTGLSLGIAFDTYSFQGLDHHNHRLNSSRSKSPGRHSNEEGAVQLPSSLRFDHVIPPLSLGPGAVDLASVNTPFISNYGTPPPPAAAVAVDNTHHRHQIPSNISTGSSSYSNNNNSNPASFIFKRYCSSPGQEDMEFCGEEEVEGTDFNKVVSSRLSDEEEEASPRKKLRLTKEQSAVLEDSFREHSTLNPNQKQALATQLNLRPRQVEVWFQNRRARTKLKQTETDCEMLKKCCQKLTEENKRLRSEIQELKSLKLASSRPSPSLMQMPATLSMCPSCGGNSAPSSNYSSSTPTHGSTSNGSTGGGPRMSAFHGSDKKQKPPGLSLNITRSSAAC